MPLIDDKGELVQIDLPTDGEWVRVKPRLSRGDEVDIRKAVVRGARVGGTSIESLDAASAIEAAEFATLEIAIKQWSFNQPVSAANIRRLDGESIDAIKERLEELYPATRTDDERGNSVGNGAGSAKEMVAVHETLSGT